MTPVSEQELAEMHKEGMIEDDTEIIHDIVVRTRGPKARGMPYSALKRLDIRFDPPVDELFAARADKPVTILSGPNNGGKTLLLKQLYYRVGRGSYLIACNRFSHVDILNTRQREANEH